MCNRTPKGAIFSNYCLPILQTNTFWIISDKFHWYLHPFQRRGHIFKLTTAMFPSMILPGLFTRPGKSWCEDDGYVFPPVVAQGEGCHCHGRGRRARPRGFCSPAIVHGFTFPRAPRRTRGRPVPARSPWTRFHIPGNATRVCVCVGGGGN